MLLRLCPAAALPAADTGTGDASELAGTGEQTTTVAGVVSVQIAWAPMANPKTITARKKMKRFIGSIPGNTHLELDQFRAAVLLLGLSCLSPSLAVKARLCCWNGIPQMCSPESLFVLHLLPSSSQQLTRRSRTSPFSGSRMSTGAAS